jgi:glutamine amidotransferase
MSAVAVVPGGGENINSVLFALERLGVTPLLTTDAAAVAGAERVILMGVGAAGPAMAKLRQSGLVECLRGLRQPVLGICLGMQLLFERSAEGEVECLGLLPGKILRFPESKELTVPHMGWNKLFLMKPANPLVAGLRDGEQAYYANSYYAPASDATVASTDYVVTISAIVSHGNFHGCQFHPEKSRSVGRRVLQNFLTLS